MKIFVMYVFFSLVIIYSATSPNWGTKKHTVYIQYCPDIISNITNCPKKVSVMKQTFLAIPETQIVISEISSSVTKYTNCQVFNAENWNCKTSEHKSAYNLVMSNGNYFDLGSSSSGDFKVLQVGRPAWLIYKIREAISSFNEFNKKIIG